MDTKLIRQYGEEILCYRLRTKRQKIRAQYNDFHKRLLRIDKEETVLHKQKFNLGLEPLTPPVQKGWKRFFVLRDDVARSKQADFYAGILAKINTTKWSHRKDFKKKRRAFGKKQYVVREQHLCKPDEQQFKKLAFTEAEAAQFHEEWTYAKWKGGFVKQYVFNEPWRFVLRVRPNMIDKIRVQDPELDARLYEIAAYFERNNRRKVLGRITGGNYRWWKYDEQARHNEVDYLKGKPLLKILDELKEEQL